MGLQNAYQIGVIESVAAGGGLTQIAGITRSQLVMNPQTTREVNAGNTYPQQSFLRSLKPVGSFTSKRVDSVLTLCGTSGYCWESTAEMRMYLVKRECAGVASGSVHDRWKLIKGIIVPKTMTAGHQADAEITCDIYAVTDSAGNAPGTFVNNVASPTPTTDTTRFTMDKAVVAGTTLLAKTSMEIDFGINVAQLGSDGELYESFAGVFGVMPTARLVGLNPRWSNGSVAGPVDPSGTAITHANTALYLKSRGIAVGTTAHIRFTMAGTAFVVEPFSGADQDPTKTSLMLEGVHDGTNVPMVATTGVAIP